MVVMAAICSMYVRDIRELYLELYLLFFPPSSMQQPNSNFTFGASPQGKWQSTSSSEDSAEFFFFQIFSQLVHDSQQLSPVSPLIYSRFRRDSNATTSSRGDVDNSFMDMDMGDYEDPREIFARQNARDSFDSKNSNIYNIYAPDEDEDLIEGSGSALSDS